MYDNIDGIYRGIVKTYLNVRNDLSKFGCTAIAGCGSARRSILSTTSTDLINWKAPVPALIPSKLDDEWWRLPRYELQKNEMNDIAQKVNVNIISLRNTHFTGFFE